MFAKIVCSIVNRLFSLLFKDWGGGLFPQFLGVLPEHTTVQATVLLAASAWQPDALATTAATTSTSAKAPTAKSATTSEWIGHFLTQVVKDTVHLVLHEVIPVVLNLVLVFLHAKLAFFAVSIMKILFNYWFSIIVLKSWFKPKSLERNGFLRAGTQRFWEKFQH